MFTAIIYYLKRVSYSALLLGMFPTLVLGTTLPPPPTVPEGLNFQIFRDAGVAVNQCVAAVRTGHPQCQTAASATVTVGAPTAEGVAAAAAQGARNASGALGAAGRTNASADLAQFQRCESARRQCDTACTAATTKVDQSIGQVEGMKTAAAGQQERLTQLQNEEAALIRSKTLLGEHTAYCQAVFAPLSQSALTSMQGNADLVRQANAFSRSLDSTSGGGGLGGLLGDIGSSDLLTYGAIGAAGVGAGYMLWGQDDKKKEAKNAARSSCVAPNVFDEASGRCLPNCGTGTRNAQTGACDGTTTTSTSTTAATDSSCTNPSNVSTETCVNHYVSVCSSSASAGGCTDFDKAYCQGTASASGDGQTDPGPGASSAYCTLYSARKFCAAGANTSAPACGWLRARGPACSNNPASATCLPQYASQTAFQQACASFSGDPLCKSSLGALIGSSVPQGTGTAAVSNSLRGVAGTNGTNSSQVIRGITGSKSSGAVTTSSVDISPRFGMSLFEKSSSAIRDLCSEGRLADCRARN